MAANVLGVAGAICWSIQVRKNPPALYPSYLRLPIAVVVDTDSTRQLIPQIIKNYRAHSTDGLHHTMYLAWAIGGIPLGVYNVVQGFNTALQVQPQILIFLSLVVWAQCQHYGAKWHWARILAATATLAACIGGVEMGLYFALRRAHRRGLEWPLVLMAVLAAVLLTLGVLRYYWEIYKSASVRGISYLFVLIDAGGDLVSILSLLFEARVDVVGVVIYAVELVLWIGISCLGIYFRLWPYLAGRRPKADDGPG